MGVKCFMVEPTTRFRAYLRRYCPSDTAKCTGPMSYHNADGPVIGIVEGIRGEDGYWQLDPMETRDAVPREDPRWPKKCDDCAYLFQDGDEWQVFHDHLYVDRAGEEYSSRALPPGAMWFADREPEEWRGPDGRTLHVICPDGWDWSPDHPASNCTMKEDRGPFGQAHRCWVRHGAAPAITVDKNGKTCRAGSGSIQTPRYHGFLRGGQFT